MTTEAKPVVRNSEAEWNALVAEAADTVPETYMKPGDIISGNGDDAPARVSALRYKGYVQVWDTQTGVESLQPYWLLWQTMRKTRPDGSPVFTRVNPHIAPSYGEDLFCFLNPSSPENEMFKGMGFKACSKQHIPHQDAQLQHLRKSHKRAWDAWERVRADRQREEDRELQRETLRSNQALIQAMVGRAAQSTVTYRPRGSSTTDLTADKPITELPCEDCDFIASSPYRVAAVNKLKGHRNREHGQ